jgi:hypothetical protein
VGGAALLLAGRAARGGMTGQARRDAAAGAVAAAVAAVVVAAALVGAVGTVAALVTLRPPDQARPGPVGRAVPENAGSRVATDTSRGANAATVAPGRALGNRRTTAPVGLAVAAALLA